LWFHGDLISQTGASALPAGKFPNSRVVLLGKTTIKTTITGGFSIAMFDWAEDIRRKTLFFLTHVEAETLRISIFSSICFYLFRDVEFTRYLPSGYVKIAIENDHRNSGFSHKTW
jgi:hypothetical protein